MRRIESKISCQYCKHEIQLKYPKPTPISVSRFHVDCNHCKSKFKMAVRIRRGTQGREVLIETTTVQGPLIPKREGLFGERESLKALWPKEKE